MSRTRTEVRGHLVEHQLAVVFLEALSQAEALSQVDVASDAEGPVAGCRQALSQRLEGGIEMLAVVPEVESRGVLGGEQRGQ